MVATTPPAGHGRANRGRSTVLGDLRAVGVVSAVAVRALGTDTGWSHCIRVVFWSGRAGRLPDGLVLNPDHPLDVLLDDCGPIVLLVEMLR